MITTKLIVIGRVQGVSYRRFVEIIASRLKLSGYVKNLDNGNVEIIVKGERKNINELIKECKIGPPLSHVQDIIVEDIKNIDFNSFEVRG